MCDLGEDRGQLGDALEDCAGKESKEQGKQEQEAKIDQGQTILAVGNKRVGGAAEQAFFALSAAFVEQGVGETIEAAEEEEQHEELSEDKRH